jgi:hypothetical protein
LLQTGSATIQAITSVCAGLIVHRAAGGRVKSRVGTQAVPMGSGWGSVSMAIAEQVMRNRAKAMRLIGIANELLAMARELEMSVQDDSTDARSHGAPAHPTPAGKDHPVWVELARQTYEDRRRRNKIFKSEELFGEPAWDILLDLFVAAKERRRVSVTSACIGSAVPSTTALRWISILERQGLLTREADPGDARRVYVRLSPAGYEAMLEYFASSSRSVVLLDEASPDVMKRR